MNATRPHWWLVNNGSGNGLLPDGTKPLPEPKLTISTTIWHHWATMTWSAVWLLNPVIKQKPCRFIMENVNSRQRRPMVSCWKPSDDLQYTVLPGKYAHCSCFVEFCCGLVQADFTHILQGYLLHWHLTNHTLFLSASNTNKLMGYTIKYEYQQHDLKVEHSYWIIGSNKNIIVWHHY